MTYEDVIAHFGTAAEVARRLGYRHRQRVHKWKTMEAIPLGDQALIELATGGHLKADLPATIREAVG